MAVLMTLAITAMVPAVATIATQVRGNSVREAETKVISRRQPQTNRTTAREAVAIGEMVNGGSWRVPGNAQGINNKKQGRLTRPESCNCICCQSLVIPAS